jgi:hypothetical protein
VDEGLQVYICRKKKKTNNIAMAFCLEQVLKLYVLERKNDLTTLYVFFFFWSQAKTKIIYFPLVTAKSIYKQVG